MFYESKVTINCLGDYIEETARLRKKGNVEGMTRSRRNGNGFFQWYRGHADESWELVPKVQRGFKGSNDEELFRKERYYTNDFQARASVLLSSHQPKMNEYASWLTLMQHYGIPTRLLDWSRSPLVALYFAVSSEAHSEKDACIWILTPERLNESEKLEKPTEIEGKQYENSFIYNMAHNTIYTMIYTAFRRWHLSSEPTAITPDDRKFDHRFNTLKDKIAACFPTEADGRVYNQLAAFTVHNSLRKLAEECDVSTLARIIIPCNLKKKLLSELDVCGITESYIYPDLEHLAKEINGWYPL